MAPESVTVVVFDTPSKDGTTWSHHVLRILFSLHHMRIPYSIENVEYPDIVSTFASTTLEPKDSSIEPYEIPVLKIQPHAGNPRYYMGTLQIIEALETVSPEYPLLYTSSRSAEFRSRFGPAFAPILQAVVGHVPNVLSERSVKSFAQKRHDTWGKPIEQWIAEHPMQEAVATAKPRLKDFGDWLHLTPGPFVNGDQVSYADFTLASMLAFTTAVGYSNITRAVLGMHQSIQILYDAIILTQSRNDRCLDLLENHG